MKKVICLLLVVLLASTAVFAAWHLEDMNDEFGYYFGTMLYSDIAHGTYTYSHRNSVDAPCDWSLSLVSTSDSAELLLAIYPDGAMFNIGNDGDTYSVSVRTQDGRTLYLEAEYWYGNLLCFLPDEGLRAFLSELTKDQKLRLVVFEDKYSSSSLTYNLGSLDTRGFRELFMQMP